jgi:hypothetical protein
MIFLQRENDTLREDNESLLEQVEESKKLKKFNEQNYSESSIIAQELISLRTEIDRLRSENKRKARSESLVSSKEKMMSTERGEKKQIYPNDSRLSSLLKRDPSSKGLEEKKSLRWNESEDNLFGGGKSSFREGSFSKGSMQYDTPERPEVRNLFGQFQKEIIPRSNNLGGSRPQFF